MAKMNLPPYDQLIQIEMRCNELERKQPKRRADYQPSFTNFDSELRQGIVMYRSGWGWRLRKNWREVLAQKMEQHKPKMSILDCIESDLNAEAGAPFCEYCHTHHFGYQDHYLA